MKWLEARRKREVKANYDRGYAWAAGIMLAGGPKEQVECLLPFDPTPFDEGAMYALRDFLDTRSNKTQEHRVYDEVWLMHNNIPTKMVIFGLSEEMNHMKTGTDLYYFLASSQVGATLDECYKTLNVHTTRQDLIDSL